MNKNNYVCYHLHTEDSLLDSCTNYKDYVDYAVQLGQKAIAFTEHGNIYNWFKKKQYCEQNGIKYIHGIECYLTQTNDDNIRDNYHTILLAKNKDGFKEINKLFFLSSQKDHFYYKRRLTFDEFFNISNNVIKISACVQSPLNKFRLKAIEDGKNTEDAKLLRCLLKAYDYYEIQYHNFPEQVEFNKYLYKMSKKFNKPLIAATDTHSLNKYKAECRVILQYGKTDGAWGGSEDSCDLTYKTYDELVNAFNEQNSLPMYVVLEAIENTNKMADSIEQIELDTTTNKYPYLYGNNDEAVLWDVIKKNYKYKIKHNIISDNPKYIETIKEEMRVFKKIDMIGFMLFMSELMTWAKDNHIATGFARGSVAGSTVAYITNITDVDPIKWNTVFSRFANENRVELGDIDTDWYEEDRQKIYDYIINRFGKDKTAYIFAATTLADKSVIDVICKAFRQMAIEKGEESPYTLSKVKEIKEEYDADKIATRGKYKDIFYYYDGLCNCIVSQSQHPAGIIVAPCTLIDNYGGFIGADGQIILPIDMDECHDIRLVKYDILGLKSVGVIDKTYKMINQTFPRADQVDWNDQRVFKDISDDSTGIFQFESNFAKQSIKKFQPRSIDDLSLINACLRPSGETYRDDVFAKREHQNVSKEIDNVLKDTLGFLVYQEQTLAFLQTVCGFSGSEADSIRRAIGKKDKEKIDEALPRIIDGYCNHSSKPRDIAEKEATEFIKVIKSSASYQFGRNHSISYSMLSYVMGYLRYYYPTEFCTAYLNCAQNDDDIYNGTALANKYRCKIVPIKFRHSMSAYSCDGKKKIIYKGIKSIKYMNDTIADELYALKDNAYDSFINLLVDVKTKTSVNSKQLRILTCLDFFNEFGEPNALLKQEEYFDKIYGKKQLNMNKLSTLGIPEYIADRNSRRRTKTLFKDFNSVKLLTDLVSNVEMPATTIYDRIVYENEYLGYIQSIFPNMNREYYFCTDCIGSKNNIAVLYRLYDGNTMRIKVRAKGCEAIKSGLIIHVIDIRKERKWAKDSDGNWYRKDEYEDVLKRYTVVK